MLASDPASCGACDVACAPGEQCQAGQCGVFCDAGQANCDGDAENGCETALGTLTDCGFCGDSCDLAHAVAECSASLEQCAIVECEPGYADCDGVPDNGCEAHTDGSALDCGVCDNACPSGPDSTAVCTDGACGLSCHGGFADCDEGPANGCEVDTNSTVSDCGGCGLTCSFANAAASCNAGLCQMGTCDGGFSDCDKDPTNGCEVDTNSPSSCGGCGQACSTSHISATCSAGSCEGGGCQSGYADCNSNKRDDGCETSTTDTVAHCGGCGQACSTSHITAFCTSGSCEVGACAAGWGDCDSNKRTNGCETSTTDTVAHCGGCGQACSQNHVNAACVSGSCEGGTCAAGWADCDATKRWNGCETNTNAVADCGGCDQACSQNHVSATCVLGSCEGGACAVNWADCNGDKRSDGCETATDTIAHCGGCQACSTNHVSAACSAGSCEGGACAADWADCDGDKRTNGCETSTTNTVAHCGGCGQACSTNHISAACSAGNCNGTCAAGWGDCDSNKRTNGCETNTTNTVAHCGGCGLACSTNHINAACAAGSCNGTCAAGWTDCNGNKTLDGCEIDLATDANNCGGCGIKCGSGEVCAASACRPANDLRANATPIARSATETTVAGTTLHATNDGPKIAGACSNSPDVWYRISVFNDERFSDDPLINA
jgi:hypothetical protein